MLANRTSPDLCHGYNARRQYLSAHIVSIAARFSFRAADLALSWDHAAIGVRSRVHKVRIAPIDSTHSVTVDFNDDAMNNLDGSMHSAQIEAAMSELWERAARVSQSR